MAGESAELIPINDRMVLVCTVLSKLRPEVAAEKYKLWLDAMVGCGISSFEEVFHGLDDDAEWARLANVMDRMYSPVGVDLRGRRVMWIRTPPIAVNEEKLAVRASCIYLLANHADLKSMREGVTVILDTFNDELLSKVRVLASSCKFLGISYNCALRWVMSRG
jgi:hypothetical protein